MRALAPAALFCALIASLPAQVTESPDTIKPGRFRLEVDGVTLAYGRADAAGNEYDAVAIASSILNIGLTRTVDIEIRADFFLKNTIEFRGIRDSHSGRGDLYLRTKWAFWRDSRLRAAAAVIPYIKLPSNTGGIGNGFVEGGFIVPWAMQFSEGASAGAQFQWDHVRNEDNSGYDAHWHVSGFAQQSITKRFSAYAELSTMFTSSGLSDWIGQLGAGLLFQMTPRLQFDYELQRGLNRRASDWVHAFRVNWDW
jgi:hypothetical protein